MDQTTPRTGQLLADPETIAVARLAPATSLTVFRAVLDAIARPGRVTRLPIVRPDLLPAALLPVLALADLEVGVVVLGDRSAKVDADRWLHVVTGATGARPMPTVDEADLVLAMHGLDPGTINDLRTGTATAPELGARLVIAVERLERGHTMLTLTGPGAANGRMLRLDGPDREVFEMLDQVNQRFPAGVDTWLVAPDGAVAAIPRSSRITSEWVA